MRFMLGLDYYIKILYNISLSSSGKTAPWKTTRVSTLFQMNISHLPVVEWPMTNAAVTCGHPDARHVGGEDHTKHRLRLTTQQCMTLWLTQICHVNVCVTTCWYDLKRWIFNFSLKQGNYRKETTSQTVGGLLITFHLVACMESNNWLMN